MIPVGNVRLAKQETKIDYGKPNPYAVPQVVLPWNFHKDMMEKLDDLHCVLKRIADALEEANERQKEKDQDEQK